VIILATSVQSADNLRFALTQPTTSVHLETDGEVHVMASATSAMDTVFGRPVEHITHDAVFLIIPADVRGPAEKALGVHGVALASASAR
jgi:hypothetical protein